jgi:hypothetical protein
MTKIAIRDRIVWEPTARSATIFLDSLRQVVERLIVITTAASQRVPREICAAQHRLRWPMVRSDGQQALTPRLGGVSNFVVAAEMKLSLGAP